MKSTTQKRKSAQSPLQRDVKSLNGYRLTDYLTLLGFEPLRIYRNATVYRSPFCFDDDAELIVFSHNMFVDLKGGQLGKLVDFACYLFGVTPEKLCADIVPFRIHELMATRA